MSGYRLGIRKKEMKMDTFKKKKKNRVTQRNKTNGNKKSREISYKIYLPPPQKKRKRK